MQSDFYTLEELNSIGFKSIGENVLISRKCSIYSPENISIGNNVRIDDFCILSGKIEIGNYVHISAYSALYGKYGIKIGDFCGISPRCTLLSATDNFNGEFLISPMVPPEYTNIEGGEIVLNNYVQICAGCVVMPKVKFYEGSVLGALSFAKTDLQEWSIYAGIPARKINNRKRKLTEYGNKIINNFYNI